MKSLASMVTTNDASGAIPAAVHDLSKTLVSQQYHSPQHPQFDAIAPLLTIGTPFFVAIVMSARRGSDPAKDAALDRQHLRAAG